MTSEQATQGSAITFVASVAKVQTMADGGLRVILDFSEQQTMQAAQLMECKRFGVPMIVTMVPEKQEATGYVEQVETGTKRKSKWATA